MPRRPFQDRRPRYERVPTKRPSVSPFALMTSSCPSVDLTESCVPLRIPLMYARRHPLCRLGGLVLASVLSSHAQEPVGRPPMPPGQHPRLFFNKRELNTIRRRGETPEGQGMLHSVRHTGHGAYSFIVKALAKRDAEWLARKRREAPRLLSRFAPECWNAALLAVMTGDARDALVATEFFRVWLSAYPPNDEIEPEQSWGNPWLAMVYDWLHEWLTDDERKRAQTIFGSMVGQPTMDMIGREWWFGGPTPAMGHVTNWTAICASSLLVTNLAIEGEPGYNPELTPHCIPRTHGKSTKCPRACSTERSWGPRRQS